ncbi:MAG: hypothetical protein BWY95_02798 [Bacteroidetes bacterium ADurb.BinA104]|nr:MAG: hypothetical protein BWY95_02798 [Bacteroidetes bacterium ADurb.BinA104]
MTISSCSSRENIPTMSDGIFTTVVKRTTAPRISTWNFQLGRLNTSGSSGKKSMTAAE